MYVTVGRDRLCLVLWHVVMPPIARGHTWLFHPFPVSTVTNTGGGGNQSDSGYRGLDEYDCRLKALSVERRDVLENPFLTYLTHLYLTHAVKSLTVMDEYYLLCYPMIMRCRL